MPQERPLTESSTLVRGMLNRPVLNFSPVIHRLVWAQKIDICDSWNKKSAIAASARGPRVPQRMS